MRRNGIETTQMRTRIRWDESKRQQVLAERGIDFELLADLMELPYIEDQRSDDPEQFRVIGFAQPRLVTFVIEYRHDFDGEYIWVITAWKANNQEEEAYERETR